MEKNVQARLIAATTAESADLVYGSGFFAPDEFIYAEIGTKRYVFVSVLEIARARREVRPGIEVVDFADVLKQAPQDCKRCLVAAISKVYGVTRWQVPERFPLIFAEKLRILLFCPILEASLRLILCAYFFSRDPEIRLNAGLLIEILETVDECLLFA